MSKQKKLSWKQKQFIKGGIIYALIVTILVAPFLSLYYCFFTPATEEQLKYFEDVAMDIYYQKPNVLYEIPDDVYVSKDDFHITVNDIDAQTIGSVKLTIEDGEPTLERVDGNEDRLFLSILLGMLLSLAVGAVIALFLRILGLI